MPTMIKSDHVAEVVWLGHVPADTGLRANAVKQLDLTFEGVAGERHAGGNRASCTRMTMLYPKGTEIRNVRQMSILSAEEMANIADTLDLDALDPALLGVSVVLSGIPDFTHVPPSSRLQGPSGVTLTVDMENLPCIYPGKEIEADTPGHGKGFKAAAKGQRGVTAWVERPGALRIGDELSLFVPTQRAWAP